MKSRETQTSDLHELVGSITSLPAVIGVLLFGSSARGDFDELSDYDLLILFEDKKALWKNWDRLFQEIGKLNLNVHAIPQTLEELRTANPVFLKEVEEHGKVLFAKAPFHVSVKPLNLKPHSLIIYSMSGLNYKDKMRALYRLYGKGGGGYLARSGGIKLGNSCLVVPSEVEKEAIEILTTHRVAITRVEAYIDPEDIEKIKADGHPP